MIESLRLKCFKNFRDATLSLGPLTVLIGANASGKSNILDAFKFLNGIGRLYSIAEILGEKYVGGERVWSGIRGGTREVAYTGSDSFTLGVELKLTHPQLKKLGPYSLDLDYSIEVSVGGSVNKPPRIGQESLRIRSRIKKNNNTFISIQSMGFKAKTSHDKINIRTMFNGEREASGRRTMTKSFISSTPIVSQVAEDDEINSPSVRSASRLLLQSLNSFRFLDLSPTQMRIPSLPGQTVLGDRGENLSSVLAAACDDASNKEALLEWVRQLTPMDVDDFLFVQDAAGRILLSLKEKNGRIVSAISASDGTLRFLAILAAFFGPYPASFYFFEELENGIHPTRLGLLVDLIENQAKRRNIQVVATSHSSLFLQFLSEDALKNASIVYRLPDHPDALIKRILDVPQARRVIKEQGVSLLHASSWFEDVLFLTEDDESQLTPEEQQV